MPDFNDYTAYILTALRDLKQDITVSEHTNLVTEAGLSSLQVMELIEKIEDQFDISIPLNILPDVNTVADLARQLDKLEH